MHWVDNTTGESFHSAHLQHPPGSVVFADVNPGLVSAVVGSSGGVLSVVKWREQAPVLGAEAIAEVCFCIVVVIICLVVVIICLVVVIICLVLFIAGL